MTLPTDTETLIVGAGLSGLRLADLLHSAGHTCHLIEARDRIGGRILTQHGLDLGPAWFWDGQPRIAAQIARFQLPVFEQYAQGDMRIEDRTGHVQQGRGPGAMQGALRVAGGLAQLTQKLADTLPASGIDLNSPLTHCMDTQDGVQVTLEDGAKITARRIVFAMPPRVVAQLAFSPALPGKILQTLQEIPTWMAGQCKALALYDDPFWRKAGLSGDAMSHLGPMVEIHDASPTQGGPYTLFGFIGIPPDHRADQHVLKQQITAQLHRLFGPQATPSDIIIKDWAQDKATATDLDRAPLYAHPRYGMPPALANIWDGRVILSGTETARDFGGYLEGALEAAEATASQILKRTGA